MRALSGVRRLLVLMTGAAVVAALLVATPAEASSKDRRTASWERSFGRLRHSLSGPAAVTVSGVRHGDQATSAGTLRPTVAWSTIKVPLAMAALRRSQSATTKGRVNRALRYSDNTAAAQLWSELGSGSRAAGRVEAVLRSQGDRRTKVQSKVVRRGASAFGQTVWSTQRQDIFLRGIACSGEGRYVRQQLDAAQSGYWGLRHFPDAIVKNGYGAIEGGFLVRQVGLVTGRDGKRWAVSIAVRASSQSRGFADATRITQWVKDHIRQVPAGRC